MPFVVEREEEGKTLIFGPKWPFRDAYVFFKKCFSETPVAYSVFGVCVLLPNCQTREFWTPQIKTEFFAWSMKINFVVFLLFLVFCSIVFLFYVFVFFWGGFNREKLVFPLKRAFLFIFQNLPLFLLNIVPPFFTLSLLFFFVFFFFRFCVLFYFLVFCCFLVFLCFCFMESNIKILDF